MKQDFKITRKENVSIIYVTGEVDLYNVSSLKKELFSEAGNNDCTVLIADLSQVQYMDSSGVGALVAGHKKMTAKGGTFALQNIPEDVLTIFKLATLDKFFKTVKEDWNGG